MDTARFSGRKDGGSHSTRLYAALLHAYPAEFRHRYADQMVLLFADELRDARRGPARLASVWALTVADLVSSAVGEHLRRDRTVAQSLAAFEPTRGMRLLGLFAVVGAALLLWAFISLNPFNDPALNRIRLVVFSLAGAAIATAFYSRQAVAAPTLARLTTASVVIAGLWYAIWVMLSASVDSPLIGAFGLVHMLAGIALWVSPAIWALGMLHTGAAWRGMPRGLEVVTKVAIWILLGSIVGWLGDDRLGLVDSLWGEMWQAVALGGVAVNGFGWLLLGVVLLFGGQARRGNDRRS